MGGGGRGEGGGEFGWANTEEDEELSKTLRQREKIKSSLSCEASKLDSTAIG